MDEGRERVAEGGRESNGKRGKKRGRGREASKFDPIDNKPLNHSILSDLSQGSHGIRAFATTPWKYKAYAVHNTEYMIVNNSRGFAIYHVRLQA